MSSSKRFTAANLTPILASIFCNSCFLQFLDIKSNTWAFLVKYLLQLEFQCCENHVMVAAYVSPWECSGVCFFDAGFETSTYIC